ncbi:MAG: hypothetical protein CSB13_05345 [Chloroflexi bacterium]|nr:MAG: hypothetical protein CSB13_05345 [Chloroflexota bacterium]
MKKLLSIKFGLFFVLATVLLMTFGIAYASAVQADTFNQGTQRLNANSSPGNETDSGAVSSLPPGNTLGNARKAFAYWDAGGTNVNLDIDTNIGGGVTSNELSFSMGSGTTGQAKVIWDGSTDVTTDQPDYDGLNVDLTSANPENDAVYVKVLDADHQTSLMLTAFGGSATNFGQKDIAIFGDGDLHRVDLVYRFVDFSEEGGWSNPSSWENVGALQMDIDGTIVDDLDITIDEVGARPTEEVREYGDLPELDPSNNPKYDEYQGAYHIPQGLTLGYNLDGESGPHPSRYANGDNNNDFDDEDGVLAIDPEAWIADGSGTIQFRVNGCIGSCFVNGWIDWNNDGDFLDANEYVLQDFSRAGNYIRSLTVNYPSGTTEGWIYARFRVCPTAATCNDPAVAGVVNGEIEDYVWYIGGTPTAVNLQSFSADATSNNVLVGVTMGLAAVLLVGFVALALRRQRHQAE